jgi:hypothetical protein
MQIGSVKPEVTALRQFFKKEADSLRIPSIQRQFVWDAEDIKELVDSIISGYPIGAVIIWEPKGKFPSAPLIGKDKKAGEHRYVLDGQQRLTALMLIKTGWTLDRGGKEITTTPISYVPDNQKLYLSSKKGIDLSLIVNASLGDAESILRLQKQYPGSYKKAMDGVGERIVNYELPFYVLKSTDSEGDEVYEKIAEIFTRVNSAGVKIGNLEMFLSFFATVFPKEYKDTIIEMHDDFSAKYELDLEPLVRFVFSRMGLSQNQITKVTSFKRSVQALKDRYSQQKKEIGKLLHKSHASVATIMDLLASELGASTTQYIPSQNALLPLFDYAFEQGYDGIGNLSGTERRKILRWFIIASFNSIYSTSTNHKLETDLEIIRGAKSKFPIDELLETMKGRSPHRNKVEKDDIVGAYYNVLRGRSGKEYLMLLDVLLHRRGATDWAGSPVVSEHAAAHHIFPREFLKDNGETRDDYINCLGNLTLISPGINSEIGDEPPEDYLKRFDEDVLEKHFIPLNTKLWKLDRFEDFLDARLKLIAKEAASLMETLESGTKAASAK